MSIFDGFVVALAAVVWLLVWREHRRDRKRDRKRDGS